MPLLGSKKIYLGSELLVTNENDWVRPFDWLDLPEVVVGDKKLVGLVAVYPHDSNFIAVNCTGDYTVDWGDGSAAENIASGVQANHIYDYNDLSSSTECSRGYRQAIVTITPQGATWTGINIGVKHSQPGLYNTTSPWLDIIAAGSDVSSLSTQGTVSATSLEQFVWVGSHSITNMSLLFYYCHSLQSVPLFDTASVTNMNNMFNCCYSLKTVPLFDTSSVTNMNGMFGGCYSLKTVPLFDTSSVTDMGSMFNGCASLQTVPLFDTSLVTNMATMFAVCLSLQSVPLLDVNSIVSNAGMASIFSGCFSLSKGALSGTKVNINYTNCRLSPAALDEIYTNLASGVTGKTITVTGNWGTSSDTPTIATAKGWTVTGS